ncbi:MAG: type VI secretion system tip protein VgrG [Gemmataceae bacterium]|nr:type VI secretion system tip protein VgrG [Gemmataceae bacterium]
MALLQQDRLVTLGTSLGRDVLLIESLEGTEGMSQLFRFQLVLVSEKRDIALNDLVGQNVTLALELAGRQFRFINGFVSRFSQGDVDTRVAHYYMEVVPWLWFLTRTTDCRIFQKKTVPDIIQQIFKDLGFTDFRPALQGSFEPREYCVQYQETDFNFISRLAEEEGIFYFFEHENGKHTLVLSNDPGVHQPVPNQPRARYAYLQGGNQEVDAISRWHLDQEFRSGLFSLTDYYFQAPSNDLLVSAPSAVKVANNSAFELYSYPGYFAKRFDGDDKVGKVRPDGERTAKLGMQAEEALHKVVNGAGACRAFVPGFRFELIEHRRADFNGPYVITQVSHSATNNLGNGEGSTYDNTFTAIPAAVPFRPERVSPRPFIRGAQTARVVGLPGEEIDTDKYARIKVQFHWDREGQNNQDSSCWIRVGTPWAGKQWGMIHIPRIGQEVIVAFLEGDPDQPIVVGSVYNAEHMPPYELPANKTQSGVKSRSSLQGTPANFNEIRFEDKKGKEEIHIHAERALTTTVEASESRNVGANQSITIANNRSVTVGTDPKGDPHQNGKVTETIFGDTSITITKGDYSLDVQTGKMDVHVKGPVKQTYDDTLTTTAKNAVTLQSASANVLIKAATEIKLECGASSITLKSDGTIEIKGVNIKTNGTASVAVDSAKIDSVATATHTIKGLMVKINS